MQLSKINSTYIKFDDLRLHQGDILRDILIFEWAKREDEEIVTQERVSPYSIVLTQDCDLEQDYNSRSSSENGHDKYLPSILLCPAYPANALRLGTHLEDLGQKMQNFTSDPWNQLKKNKLYRYHFLKSFLDLQVPDLVIDFKHYFTVPRDHVYQFIEKKHYIATVNELFRENLSGRFAHFLSRIGLPELPTDTQLR